MVVHKGSEFNGEDFDPAEGEISMPVSHLMEALAS
jgi:hypothetical protein